MDNHSALFARLTAVIYRLPEERVENLMKKKDNELLVMLLGNEQTSAESICIPFEIAREKFEAVGFLKVGEASYLCEEAIRRADNGHLVKTDEDWRLLHDNRAQLPTELRRYWLVTARPSPDGPHYVSHLLFDGLKWYDGWVDLAYQWLGASLVVRRCVS